jgi:hypothetical protein
MNQYLKSRVLITNIEMFLDSTLKFVLKSLNLGRTIMNYTTLDYCFKFLNKIFEWNREINLESFHRCVQDQMLKIHRNLRFGRPKQKILSTLD